MRHLERAARIWQPPCAQDTKGCWESSLKGKLNLVFMHIIGGKRHCNYIVRKKVSTKAGNPAAYIKHIPDISSIVELTVWKLEHLAPYTLKNTTDLISLSRQPYVWQVNSESFISNLSNVHDVLVGTSVEVGATTREVDLITIDDHPSLV
jgi:hypothetical protein